MRQNSNYLFLLAALVITAFVLPGCKDKNCPGTMIYQVPYTVSPIQDTFSVGDTIWMEMNFREGLTDISADIPNTFSNFDFKLEIQCERFDTSPPQGKTIDFLKAIVLAGEVVSRTLPGAGVSYYEALPVYKDQAYRFRSAFVLQQKGAFFCGIFPNPPLGAPFEIKGQCNSSALSIESKVNHGDLTENNYQMLKFSPEPAYYNMTPTRFGQGAFCFVVR